MKKHIMLTLILAIAMPIGASPIIQKPGLYTSDEKTSELLIQAIGETIVFNFKHTEKDGKSCGTSGTFDSSVRWAFIIEGENKLWIYRGDDKVVAKDFMMDSGPQVSVRSGGMVLQLDNETDRDLIPKELLQFIENKPNKALAPTATADATHLGRSAK